MRSVDVTARDCSSGASATTGMKASSSSDPPTWTAGCETFSGALRVTFPVGCWPARYGRKVTAGSVSSGTGSLRSVS